MYSKDEARRLLYGGGYEGENQCTVQFERAIVHETESLALERVGANALNMRARNYARCRLALTSYISALAQKKVDICPALLLDCA